METKETMTRIICATFIMSILLFMMWYFMAVSSPAVAIFRVEMDGNTLEAVKVMQASKGTWWDAFNQTEKDCTIESTTDCKNSTIDGHWYCNLNRTQYNECLN